MQFATDEEIIEAALQFAIDAEVDELLIDTHRNPDLVWDDFEELVQERSQDNSSRTGDGLRYCGRDDNCTAE